MGWFGRPGRTCEKKSLGPIMSNFWDPLFLRFHGQKINLNFFWKYCSVRTKKLHIIKVKQSQKMFGKYFLREEIQFF